MIQILGVPQSVYVRSVRLACEEKGVAHASIAASPHSPAVLAINPFGRIPVMRHGDVALFESRAISGYIDRVFPGPALMPEDAVGAALVEQWISALNTTILPAFTAYTRHSYFPSKTNDEEDRVAINALMPQVERFIILLAEVIRPSGYLASRKFTLADMALMPILGYLRVLPESAAVLERSSTMAHYFEEHSCRNSWRATEPPPMTQLGGAR